MVSSYLSLDDGVTEFETTIIKQEHRTTIMTVIIILVIGIILFVANTNTIVENGPYNLICSIKQNEISLSYPDQQNTQYIISFNRTLMQPIYAKTIGSSEKESMHYL